MRAIAYLVGAGVLFVVYAVCAAVIVSTNDYPEDGPLARDRPELTQPLSGAISLDVVLDTCFPERASDATTKVVGGEVDGEPYYACYALEGDSGGSVTAEVLDGRGRRVGDADLIKRGGAWPWLGWATSATDFVVYGAVAFVVVLLFLAWHLVQPRPGSAARRGSLRTTGLVLVGIGLGGIGLFVFASAVVGLLHPDPAGIALVSVLLSAFVYGPLAGRAVVAGRELLPGLDLGARGRDVAPALAGCLALAPALVVVLVFLSALGEVPVTSTLLVGFAVLGVSCTAIAAALVVAHWSAQRHPPRSERPTLVRGAAWGGAVALGAVVFAVALALVTSHVPTWVLTLEGAPAATAETRATAEAEPPTSTETTDEEPPSAEEARAARSVGRKSGRRVTRAHCSSGVCDVIFANGRCEVWLVITRDPTRVATLSCQESDVSP